MATRVQGGRRKGTAQRACVHEAWGWASCGMHGMKRGGERGMSCSQEVQNRQEGGELQTHAVSTRERWRGMEGARDS